jgi:hypothetical protein
LGETALVELSDFAWWIASDGTPDRAAERIAAVKPCAFGAPLRGCGA